MTRPKHEYLVGRYNLGADYELGIIRRGNTEGVLLVHIDELKNKLRAHENRHQI